MQLAECAANALACAHVSADEGDDDEQDKDTRHLRRDSCNVATDARGRERKRGGYIRGRRGVAAAPLPRP